LRLECSLSLGILERHRRKSMKVVAFNGSPRKEGNTSILIREALSELEKEKIETEMVHLRGPIRGCIACYKCFERKDGRCAQEDQINGHIEKMAEADGIILGSPTYFSDLTPELKALIDRSGFVAKANNGMFRRKVGAAVVAVRRAGAVHVFDSINHFFLINEMIIAGSSYWNIGMGREIGEVERDSEGLQTMRVLGQNMAWLMKKLKE
jgi:multimeric flavodoxin WrbA